MVEIYQDISTATVIDSKDQTDQSKEHKPAKKQRIKRGKFRRYAPHVLVAVTVTATLRIVFTNVEDTLTPLQLHVILGVIGYQVFMGHGTLVISTMLHQDVYFFPTTSKKTIHWMTQALGAACALAGTVIIYRAKETHFQSIHGILGLLSIILTAVSTLNGVVFWFWQELGITKGNIKFAHTLTGALTFLLSTLCLCYGYNKTTFHSWSSGTTAWGLTAVALASGAFFSLSPGRIVLNWFRPRDHDVKGKSEKGHDGEMKENGEVKVQNELSKEKTI